MQTSHFVRLSLLLLPLGLVLFFSNCFKEPDFVGLENIDFLSQKDSLILTEVSVQMKNPNATTIHLNKSESDVFIDGEKVGSIVTTQPIDIPKGEPIVKMPAELSLPAVSKLFPKIMRGDSCTVRIAGKYWVKAGPTQIAVKNESSKRFLLKKDVEKQIQRLLDQNAFKILEVKVKANEGQYTRLLITSKFQNPLGIAFNIQSTDLDLFLGKERRRPVGNFRTDQTLSVAPRSSREITGESLINNSESFSQGAEQVVGKIADFVFGEGSSQQRIERATKQTVRAKGKVVLAIAGHQFPLNIEQEMEIPLPGGF